MNDENTKLALARYLAEHKPYLIEIEEAIEAIGTHGVIEMKIEVRQSKVEKLTFWKGSMWLRQRPDKQPPLDETPKQ